MRLHVIPLIASLFIHAAVTWAAPSNSEELAPELRGKRSFVKRDGVKRTVFEHEATGATLNFITNSGICETTPGVNQYSGYFSVGSVYLRLISRLHEICFSDIQIQQTPVTSSGSLNPGMARNMLLWQRGSMVALGAHR